MNRNKIFKGENKESVKSFILKNKKYRLSRNIKIKDFSKGGFYKNNEND